MEHTQHTPPWLVQVILDTNHEQIHQLVDTSHACDTEIIAGINRSWGTQILAGTNHGTHTVQVMEHILTCLVQIIDTQIIVDECNALGTKNLAGTKIMDTHSANHGTHTDLAGTNR